MEVTLEQGLFFRYELGIEYGKNKDASVIIPISVHSWPAGLTIGSHWRPVLISAIKGNEQNTIQYIVNGITEWRLLGLTVYSHEEEYKGVMKAE